MGKIPSIQMRLNRVKIKIKLIGEDGKLSDKICHPVQVYQPYML